ncbi:hypothetical protein AB0F17_57015 [Nonomuraea sp. NPDC026600]
MSYLNAISAAYARLLLLALMIGLGVCADIFIDDLRWLWRHVTGRSHE